MMMRILLLASAITAAITIENHPEGKACEPGSAFNVQCNKCRCANDGSGAVCTRKFCLPGKYDADGVQIAPVDDIIVMDEEPQTCESGRRYKIDCNQCVCSDNNKLSCTRIKCVHSPEKRSIHDDYPELPDSNCEFGKTYKKHCNTCFCGKMGVTACTLMDCNADVVYFNRNRRDVENWGPLYRQGDECEPSKKFFSECNECQCGDNGRSAVCTLKMCLPHHEE